MQFARVTKFNCEKNSFNWIGTKLNLHENCSHEIFADEIKANYGIPCLFVDVLINFVWHTNHSFVFREL